MSMPLTSIAADAEQPLIQSGMNTLMRYAGPNRDAASYYEGSQVVRQFGISIPPSMRGVKTPTGWGGTTVDTLEERLDFLGWRSGDGDYGLNEIYSANALDVDAGLAHLDSLIYGVSFLSVGSGYEGEPSPLVTPHSPLSMTASWDSRLRRLRWALATSSTDGEMVDGVTLYLPDETVTYTHRRGMWVSADRDRHKLGRVPVVMVPNRIRASRGIGRSEITKPVRYYTDAAVRTLLGLEVNREFYNAPQRVGLNIDEDAFVDESGNKISQWTAIQGRIWYVPPNADGAPEPRIEQMNPSSPAPYLDQVRGYAMLLAAEAGFPASYLGYQTDNPSSADAIRAGEARLVKRAERRQTVFGRAWQEVARLALLIRDGSIPDDFDSTVSARWRDAATPTRAAAADEASKLVAAGVLPADSSITWDRIGLTPVEQRQLEADKQRAEGRGVLQALRDAAGGNTNPPA